jgi:hypothetical protein
LVRSSKKSFRTLLQSECMPCACACPALPSCPSLCSSDASVDCLLCAVL